MLYWLFILYSEEPWTKEITNVEAETIYQRITNKSQDPEVSTPQSIERSPATERIHYLNYQIAQKEDLTGAKTLIEEEGNILASKEN